MPSKNADYAQIVHITRFYALPTSRVEEKSPFSAADMSEGDLRNVSIQVCTLNCNKQIVLIQLLFGTNFDKH